MTASVEKTISDWLLEQDRTQAWLARKADMTQTHLNLILHGKRRPSVRALRQLERAMGLQDGMLVAIQAQASMPLDDGAQAGKDNR